MSDKPSSKPLGRRHLLEGYQPTDGKGCDPLTGKLDLSRLKPPTGGSAVQPPPNGTPIRPPKAPGGGKPT